MKSPWRNVVLVGALLLPLAGTIALFGCDSPTGPKYPDPIEEPDTATTDNEGATGRQTIGRATLPADSLRRALEAWQCTQSDTCR